ncbi:MAG: hypothetical protein NT166_13560 [Candidatus Aminicenantes bacterium]|nr:hypothetical protein [Candidatus Aminicenantes bacterium]
MKKLVALSLLVIVFLVPACNPKQSDTQGPPPENPKPPSWTMTGLLKDWLITPHDLVINGHEIYVSGNLDNRVAVISLDGQVLRYHTIEKNLGFDNVCVAATSQGQVLALSSRGLWELKSDGTTESLARFNSTIDHMTIGPDDRLYIASRSQGESRILKMELNGTTSNLVTINSNRISDLDFDANGNLFMADAQYGQILKYSKGQGVEIFSIGFPETAGGGPFYLAFDQAGRLYTSSIDYNLALISTDGTVIPLEFINISGDLFFHEDLLYTLGIYNATLFEISVNNTTVLSKRILLDGVVPWYIDHQGGSVVVGERGTFSGRTFFNYDITQPGRIEPNPFLNALQPSQYTFDDSGNTYLLFREVLKKLDSTGREEYSVSLPGNLQWNTRLLYNPADDKIYYFDIDSNSVIMANAQGAETYHRFLSTVSKVFITITKEGNIYAVVFSSDGTKLMDISKSPEERVVWRPNTTFAIYWFHIGSDAKGNLYAALGPSFQDVVCIDPVKGTAISIVGASNSRYGWGFVDPQGFLVTDSGTVVVSAPGVLLKFVPND